MGVALIVVVAMRGVGRHGATLLVMLVVVRGGDCLHVEQGNMTLDRRLWEENMTMVREEGKRVRVKRD